MNAASRAKCLVCGGALEQGFVIDNTRNRRIQQTWSEGDPVPSVWFGGVKKPQRNIEIVSHRCTRCGYLMEFAAEESE